MKKNFYQPPYIILEQAGSVLLMAYLNRWRSLPWWFYKHTFKSIPVANGARGMGCIGYPGHPSWEVTKACNLRCIHCHAQSSHADPNELDTDESKKLIDMLASCEEFRTLVYTGGEPLVRPDIFQLLDYSRRAGFANIIATNGTLIDEELAFKLKEHGVVCVAISLDGVDPQIHDKVRNKKGSFQRVMRAIEAIKKAGILLQINTTAMTYNFNNLSELIDFAENVEASIMLLYQLVAVGRGENIERATLMKDTNRALINLILEKQRKTSMIIEPVAGPQYWAYMLEKNGIHRGFMLNLAKKFFHGCSAGRGFVYIKANGDVWPCPFVEISGGNVREVPFKKIYYESDVFVNLRNREYTLKGTCGICDYRSICGGCRGRAHILKGDYLDEDPRCFLRESL